MNLLAAVMSDAGPLQRCRPAPGTYRGWNVKHFHEHLRRDHGFRWGYTWVKTQLHTAGLVERAKRRGAHRRKRERKPCEGMMLHKDGSQAAWLANQPMLDLIVTMDDATRSPSVFSECSVSPSFLRTTCGSAGKTILKEAQCARAPPA
jgi:hypothetical protein